ncbi:hypothetical protein HYPBUDRAFT_152919 [Hyphopichia burtonii NRRL Y-1933]|uniref:Uncharacterized protein n=1 Tax=Hyphopichia burtonii NRRL Y-1933 TaxID=984485 RepID=A0A1E4RI31_9ASCO|nr:hypothetical protein HYPBUDRAFT_152919 [Hyphopichia burtonii NRRL Y-1933]ODV66913.1 hypothetical protein HYPBUDRAFT_152919 [Hyphopichia burtonii NRRL Y-1933]
MLNINFLLSILLALSLVQKAQAETDSTTTVTITPYVTATTYVGMIEQIWETDYIYTDGSGKLTTYTTFGTVFTYDTDITTPTAAASNVAATSAPTLTDSSVLSLGSPVSFLSSSPSGVSSIPSLSEVISSPAYESSRAVLAPYYTGSVSSSLILPLESSALTSAQASSVSSSSAASALSSSDPAPSPLSPSASSNSISLTSANSLASSDPKASSEPALLLGAFSTTEIPCSVPDGDYTTSTSSTKSTLNDGSTAVLEYIVLFTEDCGC